MEENWVVVTIAKKLVRQDGVKPVQGDLVPRTTGGTIAREASPSRCGGVRQGRGTPVQLEELDRKLPGLHPPDSYLSAS